MEQEELLLNARPTPAWLAVPAPKEFVLALGMSETMISNNRVAVPAVENQAAKSVV